MWPKLNSAWKCDEEWAIPKFWWRSHRPPHKFTDSSPARCSVILPGYWKIPGYLTKNTRVFFSTPVLLTNTRVFSIKYPGIWQPVKYPGKWQLMTAETTCGLFRRISGVLSFTDFSLSSSLMLDACNLYTALLELKKLRGLREWLLLKEGEPGGGGRVRPWTIGLR